MATEVTFAVVLLLSFVSSGLSVIDKPRNICSSELCACSEKPKGIHHVVCSCPPHREDYFLDTKTFPATTLNLTISNCNKLAISGNFNQMSILRSFTLKNIQELQVDKGGFFKGHSRMISLELENVTIPTIPSGAFEGLNAVHMLIFRMIRVGKVEPGAFAKLNQVNNFEWIDSHMGHIAAGTFGYGESNVTNFHISGCTIPHLDSEAMIFNSVGNFEITASEITDDMPSNGVAIAVMRNFTLTHNRMHGKIRSRAFAGAFSESALINNNKISKAVESKAFFSLRPQFEPRSFKLPRAELNNNLFAEARNGSLAFQITDAPARFTATNNTFLSCDCEDFAWLVKQGDLGNQFYQQLVNTAKCLRQNGPVAADLRTAVVKQLVAGAPSYKCKDHIQDKAATDDPHAFPEVRRPPTNMKTLNKTTMVTTTTLPPGIGAQWYAELPRPSKENVEHFTLHTTTPQPPQWRKPQYNPKPARWPTKSSPIKPGPPSWPTNSQQPTTLGTFLYVEPPTVTKIPSTTQSTPVDVPPHVHPPTTGFSSNNFLKRIGAPVLEDEHLPNLQEPDDTGHIDMIQVAKCGGLCDCFEKGGAFEVYCTCKNRQTRSMLVLPKYLPRNTGNLTIAKCSEVTIRETFRVFVTLRQVTIAEVTTLLIHPFSFLYKSSNLHQVLISHTGIPELPIGSFSHASYVHILGFHDVRIQRIRRDSFGGLVNVNYIYFEESVLSQIEMSAFGNYSSSVSYLRFANSTIGLDPAALKLKQVEDLVIDRCTFPSGIPPGGISAQSSTNFHLLRSSIALLQPHAFALTYNETAAVEANIFRGLIANNAFRSLIPNVSPPADTQHLIVANNVFLRAEEGSLDLVLSPQQNAVVVNNTLAICHCSWFQQYANGDRKGSFLGQMLRSGRCVTRDDVYLQPGKITDPNFECGAVF